MDFLKCLIFLFLALTVAMALPSDVLKNQDTTKELYRRKRQFGYGGYPGGYGGFGGGPSFSSAGASAGSFGGGGFGFPSSSFANANAFSGAGKKK